MLYLTRADVRMSGAQADRQHYQAFDRLQGLLTAAAEELPDVPLYFKAHDLAHTLKTTPPPAHMLRSAIVNAGEPRQVASYVSSRRYSGRSLF